MATLVAVIVTLVEDDCCVVGAVYNPLALIAPPPLADQVTDVFEVPVTVAVNCSCSPYAMMLRPGEGLGLTETVITAFSIAITRQNGRFGALGQSAELRCRR